VDRSGVAPQVRRAAPSIPANSAEGCSRSSNQDFARFLQIAIAPPSEVEDHLQFASNVALLPPNNAAALLKQVVEIRRMFYGLLKRVHDENGDGER
jgi:four helix bundle protein